MDSLALYNALKAAKQSGHFSLFEINADVLKKIEQNPLHKRRFITMRAFAAKYRAQPIESLPYSLFARYEQTGEREIYEKLYFDRRMRLQTLAVSCLFETRDFTTLADCVWSICEETTWCLPAHFMPDEFSAPRLLCDNQDSDGYLQGTVKEHAQTIDLFSVETAFALTEILSLLEKKLPQPVVFRARREIFKRVLEPFLSFSPLSRWELMQNNWNAVCAGGIGSVAVYLIEDESLLVPLLQKMMNALDGYTDSFGNDGVCTEGASYWTYGFGFYVCFADILLKRTGGAVDLFADPKIASIASFQQNAYFDSGTVISFSDSGAFEPFRIGLSHYLSRRFKDVLVPDEDYQMDFDGDSCARFSLCLRDFLWTERNKTENPATRRQTDEVHWYPDAQWLVAHSSATGVKGTHFAAKGGHNDESHNHNDIGSFIYRSDGTTFLADFGSGLYTKDYFSPKRYELFCTCSRGHSVPVINGHYQKPGKEFRANEVFCSNDKKNCELRLNMADAYGLSELKKLERTFNFNRENGDLSLNDIFVFSKTPSEIKERFVSECEICLENDAAVFYGEEANCVLSYDPAIFSAAIGSETFTTHKGAEKTVHILDLHARIPAKDFRCMISITRRENFYFQP